MVDHFLNNKKAFMIAGCELTYVRDYLRKEYKLDVDHTFELNTSMDPQSELNMPESKIYTEHYDYIFVSQVQLYRRIFGALTNDKKGMDPIKDIDQLANQLKASIEKITELHDVPIFIMTHPVVDLKSSGNLAYKYSLSVTELKNYVSMKLYDLCRECENAYLLDIDDIFKDVGQNSETIRLEFSGRHPEKKHAWRIAERFVETCEILDPKLKRVKCVAIDLDNTIWKGVLREDGPENITFGTWGEMAQRIIAFHHLARRGIVLAICSKNDPEDVVKVKEILKEYKAFLNDIVYYKVNWKPKSVNIRELSEDLNISLDTIAFFDDNAFERDEVKTNLPEVRVYADDQIIDAIREPAFQPSGKITKDAKNRISFYKAEAKRNEQKHQTESDQSSYEDYLRGLGLEMEISLATNVDLERMAEIFQRTNQQNVTLKRLDKTKIKKYQQSPDKRSIILDLEDKFGEYGTIGAAIIDCTDAEYYELEEFALSCRAMGRKVENVFINFILNTAIAKRMKGVRMTVTKTSRNEQIVTLLKTIGFEDQDEASETSIFQFDTENCDNKLPYPDWFDITLCDLDGATTSDRLAGSDVAKTS